MINKRKCICSNAHAIFKSLHCSLRSIAHAFTQTHTQVSLRMQFIARAKSQYFHFSFCFVIIIYIYPVRRNFSLNIIYRKFKMQLIVKYFKYAAHQFPQTNHYLLLLDTDILFMFALSRTMYLFEANLNLLANTSSPDVAQYYFGQNLTVSHLRCWSTGLTERETYTKYTILKIISYGLRWDVWLL